MNIFDKHDRRTLLWHRRGLSYVEVMLATVIMSVLLVAAVRLFANLGRSALHTSDAAAAATLAVEMIEEIRRLPYKDPYAAAQFGPGDGETDSGRVGFDDIDDYHNWSACPPEDRAGQPYSQYPRLTRSVTVRHVEADDFTQPAGASDEGFKEVTITISTSDRTIAKQRYVLAMVSEPIP